MRRELRPIPFTDSARLLRPVTPAEVRVLVMAMTNVSQLSGDDARQCLLTR